MSFERVYAVLYVNYLAISITEDNGHQTSLQPVQESVHVVIYFDPFATFIRRPVDRNDEMKSKQRYQYESGSYRFPVPTHFDLNWIKYKSMHKWSGQIAYAYAIITVYLYWLGSLLGAVLNLMTRIRMMLTRKIMLTWTEII